MNRKLTLVMIFHQL